MSTADPIQIESWLLARLTPHADEEYAERMRRLVPGSGQMLGVPLAVLRDLARDANSALAPEPQEWAKFISFVIPNHHRELILTGALGLGRSARVLDDLFGERVGGWARELDNWETTDHLAAVVGWWVLDDLSRVGYLEAYAARGETVWKKRLAAVATVTMNRERFDHPNETFRVLRHLMLVEDPTLVKAVGWALREVKDNDAVERFLAWWAPRVKKSLLREATKSLDENSRNRILELA